ncbi:hypothetical protein [Pseudonocardia sp.]|jgi:hypothetical protein|uniref:hypothetical protein n=1 Tax=Pseudonocardia sp. TaxID=60912 RepID=UPI003D1327DE
MSALRSRQDNTVGAWARAQETARENCEVQDQQAARVVAGQAVDADDCRELLAMLGLSARAAG